MNDSPAQQAARARAHRRKRMQQRQTVIFGSIIAVLLGVALFAGAIWAELIPAPLNIEVKAPEAERATVADQPCPPEGAVPVPFEDIDVNILNSTQTSGLGARTAEAVREFGANVGSVGNASGLYLGSAKIVTGFDSLAEAYTIADLISEAVIDIDERTEEVVDIVIGSSFTSLREAEDLVLVPEEAIPAPEGCIVVAGTSAEEGASPESDDARVEEE